MPERSLRDRIIDLEDPSADIDRGRAIRKTTPRSAVAQLNTSPRSATEIVVSQNANRLREFVALSIATPPGYRPGGVGVVG